jgi:hypothetical protein
MPDGPDRTLEWMSLLACVVTVGLIFALAYFAYLGGS